MHSLLLVFHREKKITQFWIYNKTCLKRPLKKKTKIGFQDRLLLNAGQKYCRMLQGEHSAILSTYIFVIKISVLSIFKWPLKTGFTVRWSLCGSQYFNHGISPRNYRKMAIKSFIILSLYNKIHLKHSTFLWTPNTA